jgi:Formyl transferase
MNLGVLASHGGTTLQSLIDAFARGRIPGRVSVVVSNNGDSGALVKARQAGVQAVHLSSRTHPDPATLDAAIQEVLVAADVDVVCLAGYIASPDPERRTASLTFLPRNVRRTSLNSYFRNSLVRQKRTTTTAATNRPTTSTLTSTWDVSNVKAQAESRFTGLTDYHYEPYKSPKQQRNTADQILPIPRPVRRHRVA